MPTSLSLRLRSLAAATAALVVAALLHAAPASADTAPQNGAVATVSADALGTVQIDGVVWSTHIVGNTVYVGGSFANARPAGSAAGTNQTPRANLLAFNLTTGALITGFVANTNGVVNSVTSSPDGTRIYIGGAFTTVNGTTRNRVAALNPTTGAVISGFAPSVNSAVEAVVATNSTVYIGGNFTSVAGQSRNRLASLNATSGAVNPLSVQVDDRILALALSPDGGKLVLGGYFTNINGSTDPGFGFGAVNSSTGQVMAWNINKEVRQAGRTATSSAAIYSLKSDSTGVYGTAYMYPISGKTLEGSFRAEWSNGDIVWLNTCKGDSYDVAMTSSAVYLAGHPHDCSTVVGGFRDAATVNPRVYNRGMAWSKAATSNVVLSGEFAGNPTPAILNWWPTFNSGTYTGQNQGPWSVAATDSYVVYAGEFTTVNSVGQQGIVRFASRSIAPNVEGPRLSGSSYLPSVTPVRSGTVSVRWPANWDRDNEHLTYELLRDGSSTTPIYTTTQASRAPVSDRPTMSFLDSGLAPGSSHNYRVRVRDPLGNTVTGNAVTVTIPSAVNSAYMSSVQGNSPTGYWRLGESSGTAFSDAAGVSRATFVSGVTLGQTGALAGDRDTAARFPGTVAGVASTGVMPTAPQFASEAWFSTTSTTGGNIVTLGNSPRPDSTGSPAPSSDRNVYIDGSGRLAFAVSSGREVVTLQTASAGYNDGKWHHVVASVGSGGMAFYVDGVLAGTNSSVTSVRSGYGYWRIGGDVPKVSGAPSYFSGAVDEVAVYAAPLTAAQVQERYKLAGGAPTTNAAPAASFTSTVSGLTASVDGTGSTDSDGTIASYSWNWGDGTAAGSGATASHTYAAAGTYTVTLTVTDDKGATDTETAQVTVASSPPPTGTSARDDFARTVTGGWGDAPTGGTWTRSSSTTSAYSVDGAVARLTSTSAGQTRESYLIGVTGTNADVQSTVAISPVNAGGSVFASVIGRRISAGVDYRARAVVASSGAVSLQLQRSGTTLVQTSVSGLTYAAGDQLRVRLQVTGTNPTTIQAKVWKVGTAEPAAWQLSTTDTTAELQTGGHVGLGSYVGSTLTSLPQTVAFDDFAVTQP
ncbi:PKD domain-containing protein [Naasia sp. SYSU D00057]|uniref:PKD domain-containing protein n=1 Tax=Naasia sp. SYSU D00057 TaxID=2817380 RepID=UPI001B308FBE|nr:PKD domain-containing protein [Naasia sp. SYSU D00057]